MRGIDVKLENKRIRKRKNGFFFGPRGREGREIKGGGKNDIYIYIQDLKSIFAFISFFNNSSMLCSGCKVHPVDPFLSIAHSW